MPHNSQPKLNMVTNNGKQPNRPFAKMAPLHDQNGPSHHIVRSGGKLSDVINCTSKCVAAAAASMQQEFTK